MHEHTITQSILPLKPGVHCSTIQSKPSLQYVHLLCMMKFYGKFTQDCGMPEHAPLRLEKLCVSSWTVMYVPNASVLVPSVQCICVQSHIPLCTTCVSCVPICSPCVALCISVHVRATCSSIYTHVTPTVYSCVHLCLLKIPTNPCKPRVAIYPRVTMHMDVYHCAYPRTHRHVYHHVVQGANLLMTI